MKNSRLRVLLLAAVAAVLTTVSAKAGLTGSVISLAGYYPDTNSLYTAFGNRTVSDAIEYPTFTLFPYAGSPISVDITDTQLVISNNSILYGYPYMSAAFNGWVLTIVSGSPLISVAPDPSSQCNPVEMWVENGNQLWMNFEGETVPANSSTIIDINPVPEPSTIVLLGLSIPVALALKSRFLRHEN